MKIGIDVRLWNETGVGRYIRNLISHLAVIDDKNDYVLFAKRGDREAIKRVLNKRKWKIVTVDIRWHTVTEQFLFASIINKEHLHLMHFPYFSVPVLYRKPFVVTIHDLILHHFPTGRSSTLPLPLYQVKRLGYEQVLQHAVKRGKKIIVPLTVVKKDLVSAFHVPDEKIAVTPEGFDQHFLSEKEVKIPLPNKKFFLYVGNAYPHKNLTLLLKAFTEYQEKNNSTDIGLVLVGKDDYFYKKMREELKKEKVPNVSIVHDVSDAQLAYLYRHAIALLSPSLMEGFGLTALEAMGLSCIPVLSDIPAFREVCGDAAVYFNPTSPKSMREKMELVANMTADERKEFLKRGHERIRNFSWKSMAEETLRIYEECASKK